MNTALPLDFGGYCPAANLYPKTYKSFSRMLLPTGLDPWVLRLKHIPGCWSPPRRPKDFWLARQVYLVFHSWMLPLYRQDDGTLTFYQVPEVTALKEGTLSCNLQSENLQRVACLSEPGSRLMQAFPQ